MWSQVCTDTPRSDPYVLSQLHARKQAPDPSVRPRLHTTSEEMMFLFVSPLVDIKLSHGESQRAQRESFPFFFLPPSTIPLSFFSIMLSYFSLFASSFIICTPNPPVLLLPCYHRCASWLWREELATADSLPIVLWYTANAPVEEAAAGSTECLQRWDWGKRWD